ncbi:MAG: YeeE/YedE family protein, partial [Anaerolineales bacterium]|nr:YeeE/YedE family protein [Anaerolineales bacterium]
MLILLAIIAGAGLGYLLERGDFCFHSTLRGLFRFPRQLDLFRAYLLALLIATPLVYGMRTLGWIDPWIPPFAWQANIFGGLVFGVGMVVAASCITGFFYKLGHGMLGTLVGLGAWAVGDILVYRGALSPLREQLTAAPLTVEGNSATVLNLFGPIGAVLLIVLGLAAAIWLWRSTGRTKLTRGKLWGWLPLGIAVGVFTSLAWLLAKAGGSNYPYGTSYVPTAVYEAIFDGSDISLWIPI